MGRGDLTTEEWARLKPNLPKSGQPGGRWQSHRRVINGILFRQRTGLPWRDQPTRFASGRPFTSGTDGGRRTAPGRNSSRRSWPTPRAARLVDGERGLHLLPSPPARRWSAQKRPPRVPGIDARPDSTAPTRDSDAPGAAAAPSPCWSRRASGATPRSSSRSWNESGSADLVANAPTRPDHLGGNKAYSSRRNRLYLRRPKIRHTVPEPSNQRANRKRRGSCGGRPTARRTCPSRRAIPDAVEGPSVAGPPRAPTDVACTARRPACAASPRAASLVIFAR